MGLSKLKSKRRALIAIRLSLTFYLFLLLDRFSKAPAYRNEKNNEARGPAAPRQKAAEGFAALLLTPSVCEGFGACEWRWLK